jgi:hypothetical protein
MEDKRKQLAEAIKSIITSSPEYEKIQSELKDDRFCVKVRITFNEGIEVLVEKDIPKWSTDFAANSVGRGQVYSVYFQDGNKGMLLHRLNNTYTPLCKLTEKYPSKIFVTKEDAIEALYASISEFGDTLTLGNVLSYL